jgi:hypothetical protein
VVRDLFRLGINHKIIFGTDWPLFSITAGTKSCVDVLMAKDGPMEGLNMRDIELIMGGNIERLIPQASKASAPRSEEAELSAVT